MIVHNLKSKFLILMYITLINISSTSRIYAEIDTAPPSQQHIKEKVKFREKYFMDENGWSLPKIEQFLERLKREKNALGQDLYESKTIESFHFEVRSDIKRRERNARRRMLDKYSNLLKGYSIYLFPKIEAMIQHLKNNGKDDKLLTGLFDDFIRLYCIYFVPNNFRGTFADDYSYSHVIKKSIKGYHFLRKSKKYVEAINLKVETNNQNIIQECLKTPIPVGHFLLASELQVLDEICQIDISSINPGISALWKDIKTQQERNRLKYTYDELFPQENERIVFTRVKLSGNSSPKITGKFERNGKKTRLKIKFGWEVHTKIATSYLAKFVGLNQDILQHRELVRVYFEKGKTYKEFVAEFIRKYRKESIFNYVLSHGKTDDGQEWVEFQDVQLQVQDPQAYRLEAVNPKGWDFDDRREYRALILFYGWLNIIDTKIGNFRTLLRRTPNGYVPEHRLHDTGASLGRNMDLRKKSKAFNEFRTYGANLYDNSFLEWNDSKVKVWWADFITDAKPFSRSTFNDLKWMARKIARLSEDDIYFALRTAAFPEEIIDLYKHKISKRRNEIIKAFNLEDEFELFEVPDLRTYSPNSAVKNGIVVVAHFHGHNELEKNRSNALTMLSNFISLSLPMSDVTEKFEAKIKKLSTGEVGVRPIKVQHMTPGLNIILGREVNLTGGFFTHKGDGHGYYIKDTIGIELNINSSFMKTLMERFPVEFSADMKVWRREISFVHFADTLKKAYFSRFKLFNILRHLHQYVAMKLNPGEVIRIVDGAGIELSAKVGVNAAPVIENDIYSKLNWTFSSPLYFHRDHFGQLKIYKEKSLYFGLDMGLNLGDIDLLAADFPFLGLGYKYDRYSQKASLYSFSLPYYKSGGDAVDQLQRQREYKALRKFLRHGPPKQENSMVNKEMSLNSFTKLKKRELEFLFFFFKKKTKGYSRASIKVLDDGKYRKMNFHRYYYEVEQGRGIREPHIEKEIDIGMKDSVKSSITSEMNLENPDDFVIYMQGQKYHRKMGRNRLVHIINRQNKKFSQSEELPFYRNYILPPKDEINLYRKIYVDNYVYFNSTAIFNLMKENTNSFHKKLKHYFHRTWPGKTRTHKVNGLLHKINTQLRITSIMREFKKLKKFKTSYKVLPKKFLKQVTDFFITFHPRKNGIGLLRDIMGVNNLYVMGQIYGVNRSFNTIERLEDKRVRRFAGKHWGKVILPPIKRYNRWTRILPLSEFIESELDINTILGEIPNMSARMD